MHELTELISKELPPDICEAGVMIAVSGGADSVALLRAFVTLRENQEIPMFAGHLNHGLRGIEADEDANWLTELCANLEIPLMIGRINTAESAEKQGETIEEAARNVRYRFLEKTARTENCRYVAVAHTADDQAETILHHILRGTGISGLRGIPQSRPLSKQYFQNERDDTADEIMLVRPLLSVTRRKVEKYLADIGQTYRHDRTNDDSKFTRNRIRNELIPQLQQDYHPGIQDALLRLGQQAAEWEATFKILATRLLDEATEENTGDICRLNCGRLLKEPRPLIRECLTELWKRNHWPRKRMGFAHWDRLAELVASPTGAVSLPSGIEARRRGQLLVLSSQDLP
jgi:tRNA(Ile)-lysidine synthase